MLTDGTVLTSGNTSAGTILTKIEGSLAELAVKPSPVTNLGATKTATSATLTWIVLIGVAVVMTVGMSWAHLKRRLSGQATVDDVND